MAASRCAKHLTRYCVDADLAVGYVVRRMNEEPMGGLSVAQVASRFRNVGQVRSAAKCREKGEHGIE